MPRYNLDQLEQRLQKFNPSDVKKSREWFSEQARKLGNMVSEKSVMTGSRQRSAIYPGRMYLYQYYPIGVKTLPYYDALPLVIPFSADEKTFTGLNFHYLPYKVRYVLLKNLLDFATNKKLDDKTKLRLSWQFISGVSRYRGVSAAVHKYRYDRVMSHFMEVPSNQWFMALLLPVERFKSGEGMQYMDKNYVWQQSMQYL